MSIGPRQGVLKVVMRKGGRSQVMLERQTKKGRDYVPAEGRLAADLQALSPKALEGLEVDYDNEGGQAVRIRRRGSDWVQAGSVPGRARSLEASPKTTTAATSTGRSVPERRFHNPYNFVPALRRDTVTGDLGDHPPAGHHRYHPDLWSGTICVRLTTRTPLLIPDSAQASCDQHGHKTFGTRVGLDGRPYLPPTSVKGALRSAYEAITNSRLGVFGRHDRRLAYRMDARDGLLMIPAIVEPNPTGGLHARLLCGTSKIGTDGRPDGPMYAAWLPMYGRHARLWGPLASHGATVWAYITEWQHSNPNFLFWNVAEMQPGGTAKPTHTPTDTRPPWNRARPAAAPPGGQWVRGYVCITRENIDRKHDERIFFESPSTPTSTALDISPDVKHAWSELIADYQEVHASEIGRGIAGPSSLTHSVWSRHISTGSSAQALTSGALCYGRVRRTSAGLQLLGLYPVMISRQLFSSTPADRLHRSLHPASSVDELSPADRVFGWVSQDGEGAYRGNVRIGPVRCESENAIEEFNGAGVPLAILGEPKPQQVRFYVGDERGGALPGMARKSESYATGQALRGRKVYPHHAQLKDGSYWENAMADRTQVVPAFGKYAQEYRRPHRPVTTPDETPLTNPEGTFGLLEGEVNERRDDQNRSMTSWVKPNSEFSFDLTLTNLSPVELGALLWLLTLPRDCFHRLGGAKPLGFGSVHLSIDSVRLSNGLDLKRRYLSLTPSVPGPVPDQDRRTGSEAGGLIPRRITNQEGPDFAGCRDAFLKALAGAYRENAPFVKTFLAAARGADDGLPVHYPRVSSAPHPEGRNYEWFVKNEQGTKAALPSLGAEDTSLPLPSEGMGTRG